MNLILRNIAFVNVQKLPAKTRTSDAALKNAYQKNKEILLEQIATYRPDIIIGGKTLHLFKDDLRITKENELKFGHFSKDKTLFSINKNRRKGVILFLNMKFMVYKI